MTYKKQCMLSTCDYHINIVEDSLLIHLNSVKARMATGYNVDGSVALLTDLGWIAPAGQMYSTINDLNKVYYLTWFVYPVFF